jgi:hypothetical protein
MRVAVSAGTMTMGSPEANSHCRDRRSRLPLKLAE